MLTFLKRALSKTLENMRANKDKNRTITKDLLEELLLEADVGYEITQEIIYYLPPSKEVKKEDLKRVMTSYFLYANKQLSNAKPFVELILGVNGSGKTTSIAKLAHLYKNQGQKVILGACDTFRAGAIEQLKLWSEKIGTDIVFTAQGHDPSAVAYDTILKAIAKNYDRVLLDTAGRLQNQKNLMNELEKIIRISAKAMQTAPHRKILVLDASQGNAGILQAKAFNELISLDGVIITKLDGTAKGGVLFSIARELELPIIYMGIGEKMDDICQFNVDEYLDMLLKGVFD